jgi:hypothetical protein
MSKISSEHLLRGACVYIRQSTADQLVHNQESQRRQYGLADRAISWAGRALKSSTMIWVDRLGASTGLASSAYWQRFAKAASVLCSLSRRPG